MFTAVIQQQSLSGQCAARSGDVRSDRNRSRRGGTAGWLAARPSAPDGPIPSRSCGSESQPDKREGGKDKGRKHCVQRKSRPGGTRFWEFWSGKRDSNPRLRPWQGRTLPLSYSRPASARPLLEHGPTAVCEEVMVTQRSKFRQGAPAFALRATAPQARPQQASKAFSYTSITGIGPSSITVTTSNRHGRSMTRSRAR